MRFNDFYLQGVADFNAGHYYEAHEAWEKIWLKSEGFEKIFYQGLIQSAAALLKLKTKKCPASVRLFDAAFKKLSQVPEIFLGLNVRQFEIELKKYFEELKDPPKIFLKD